MEFSRNSTGPAGSRGHLSNNAGIRGHSAGPEFPFVVFAEGSFDNIRWRVLRPDGRAVGSFRRAKTAGEYARYLKQERDK